MLKKGDLALAAIVLFTAAAVFFAAKGGGGAADGNMHRIAVIKRGDKVERTINLDEVHGTERIHLCGDYSNVILIEKGRIRFEESDCPDRLCVKTGWIERVGDAAVCLPNRVMIKIEGKNIEVDGVTY